MRCPNCGRENPGIRLFCSRCGELLPESEAAISGREAAAVNAERPDEDDDIKIYRRPGATREIADEPEPERRAWVEPMPEDSAELGGDETDFFSRRERVRRLYEEDWPELSARRNENRARGKAADGTEPPDDLFFEDGFGAENLPERGDGRGSEDARGAGGEPGDAGWDRDARGRATNRGADGGSGLAHRDRAERGTGRGDEGGYAGAERSRDARGRGTDGRAGGGSRDAGSGPVARGRGTGREIDVPFEDADVGGDMRGIGVNRADEAVRVARRGSGAGGSDARRTGRDSASPYARPQSPGLRGSDGGSGSVGRGSGEAGSDARTGPDATGRYARPMRPGARGADEGVGDVRRGSGAGEGDARRDAVSPYARPVSPSVRRPPTLTRKDIADTGRVSTLVPRREETINPDNLFSVRGQTPLDVDDFDRVPKAPQRRARRYEGAYEEPESHSFFMRHVRGIVGLILLAMTATIVLTWAYTPSAQLVLARIDLAWSASAYARLGLEAYEAQEYGAAGRYFRMALARDADNYDYAVYAANSYIALGDTDDAIAAVEACIAIDPGNAEQYVALIGLYGGRENMPEDARGIVARGYELTGDERLK